MKTLLFILINFLCFQLIAQEQAWIFLTEKPNSTERLANPNNFLTQKSILRKQKFNTQIDARDLPIENTYVNEIKAQTEITYLATSKWFNGIYVEGDQIAIEALLNLEFVDSIFFMNRSLNTSAVAKKIDFAKESQPNKTETIENFNYGDTQAQINQLNLQGLHNENYTGTGITIAVMDSGFNNVNTISAFDRARDNNLLLGGYDFEDKTPDIYAYTGGSHGTNVLSTMLGYIENEFVGTAIDAQYYLFRTEVDASETPKEEAYWIAAAERADSLGVDIINTSLGYSDFDGTKYDYATTDMDGETAFISQATTIALEKGMLPINSAGNSGGTAWNIITAPADSPGALSIGAVAVNGSLASFSSVGPTADGRIKPDVVAMGVASAIITTNGTIAASNGTSFSGPIMAGAVACLWQSMPNKSATEIMDLVRASGNLANNPNSNMGYGIPNFGTILGFPDIENTNAVSTLKILKNPVGNSLNFEFPNEWSSQNYIIYDTTGKQTLKGILNKNDAITVANLNSGIYFLATNGIKDIVKFVKE